MNEEPKENINLSLNGSLHREHCGSWGVGPEQRGAIWAEARTHNPWDAYSPGRFLTNTVALISVQFKAKFTLAAEAQAAVVCPVTQNTDLLTAPVVTPTRIAGCGEHTYYDT